MSGMLGRGKPVWDRLPWQSFVRCKGQTGPPGRALLGVLGVLTVWERGRQENYGVLICISVYIHCRAFMTQGHSQIDILFATIFYPNNSP